MGLNGEMSSLLTDERRRIALQIGEMLDRQAGYSDIINPDRVFQLWGVEAEKLICTPEASVANSADVLQEVPRRVHGVESELARNIVELVTDPVPCTEDGITTMYGKWITQRHQVCEAAERLPKPFALLSAALPFFLEEEDFYNGGDMVSTLKGRYAVVWQWLENIREEHNTPIFQVPKKDGGTLDVQSRPQTGAMTCGQHFNIEVNPRHLGDVVNLVTALSFVFPTMASTSPFVLGRVGAFNSRAYLLRNGFSSVVDVLPFGLGTYLQNADASAYLEFHEALPNGDGPKLNFEQAEINRFENVYPATRVYSGTRWLVTYRIQPCFREDKLVFRVEIRLPDCGLTMVDDIANFMMFAGAIAGCVRKGIRAQSLMTYEDAERAFFECAATGDCTMKWERRVFAASNRIREFVLPMAREGLLTEGLDPEFVDEMLDVCRRRIKGDNSGWLTPADWMLRRMAHLMQTRELSETAAIKEIADELPGRQRHQPLSLSKALEHGVPSCDWSWEDDS